MNRDDFERSKARQMARLMAEKEKQYAKPGKRYLNFENGANMVKRSPESILWGYALKHAEQVSQLNRGRVTSEKLQDEVCSDLINYMCILVSMVIKEDTVDVQAILCAAHMMGNGSSLEFSVRELDNAIMDPDSNSEGYRIKVIPTALAIIDITMGIWWLSAKKIELSVTSPIIETPKFLDR